MEQLCEITRKLEKPKRLDSAYKIICVGEIGCGKSSLIRRIVEDVFSENYKVSLECSQNTLYYEVKTGKGKKNVKLDLWDTVGDEKYASIGSRYYKNSHAVLLLYDITSKHSWERIPFWIKTILEVNTPDVYIWLIGTKKDLFNKQEVDLEAVENYVAENNRIIYQRTEVSSKTGDGIKELFDYIIKKLTEGKYSINETDSLRISMHSTFKKKENCQC